MARLNIVDLAPGVKLCVLSGVLMPNGEKRDYVDFSNRGFVRILKRIKAEKAVIRLLMLLKRIESGQKALPQDVEV